MHIVPIYAAVLALLFVGLSARIFRMRQRHRSALGDAGAPALVRAVRTHGNFAEFVPLGLILFSFVEVGGAAPMLVHGLGLSLLLGRSSHAYGVSQINERYRFRVFGMTLTILSIVGASFLLFCAAIDRSA